MYYIILTCTILYLQCDERKHIQWNIAWAWRKCRGRSPRNFLRAHAIFHRICWLESHYRHSQLQFRYSSSWESNIGRVDSPYCSASWGYISNSISNRKFCFFSFIIAMVHQNSPTMEFMRVTSGRPLRNRRWILGGPLRNRLWILGSPIRNHLWILGGPIRKPIGNRM